jgi:hypothetical protein
MHWPKPLRWGTNQTWRIDKPELHFPKYDKPTFPAVRSLMRDIRPHGFIFGGDQFANAEISHHNQAKHLYKERGSYRREHRALRCWDHLPA